MYSGEGIDGYLEYVQELQNLIFILAVFLFLFYFYF
jgi:hypothetical protein